MTNQRDQDIIQQITFFKSENKKARNNTIFLGSFLILILIFLCYYCFSSGLSTLLSSLLIGLAAYAIYRGRNIFYDPVISDFKDTVVKEIIGRSYPDLDYDASGHIPESTFIYSGLFNKNISKYLGEDLIFGKIDKTEVSICELRVNDIRGEEDSFFFKGVFIEADFHKDFRSIAYLIPNDIYKEFVVQPKKWKKAKQIHFEDPVFEDIFCVYTTNEQEARYILSPTMMKSIIALQYKFGERIRISFKAGKMYMALSRHHDNTFDGYLNSEMSAEDIYQTMNKEIQFILSIIEDLNLNTRIWSKQEGLDLREIDTIMKKNEDDDLYTSK